MFVPEVSGGIAEGGRRWRRGQTFTQHPAIRSKSLGAEGLGSQGDWGAHGLLLKESTKAASYQECSLEPGLA
jgi:hypothetical protein